MTVMKKLQTSLTHLSIALLLVASPLAAWMDVNVTWNAVDPAEGGRTDAYREAQRALTNENWEEAERLFAQIADGGGNDADAALYWEAYVQLKRGRASLARETVQRLREDYSDSPWIDDARALEVEARQASGRVVNPVDEDDEELKLYALNSLMHMDSERAIPVLEDFLQGDHSVELKEKALFVLSQSGSSQAREILVSVAKGQQHPELRPRARQSRRRP
jgi:HEAT repeat protein